MAEQKQQDASGSSSRWKLRVRGPKGTPGELDLDQGGETTSLQLARLASKASRIPQKRLVIKHGFPPKDILAIGSGDGFDPKRTVSDLGVRNRDLVHVELASKAEEERTAGVSKPSTSKRTKQPSNGEASGRAQKAGAGATPVVARPSPGGKTRIDKHGNIRQVQPRRKRVHIVGAGRRLAGDAEDCGDGARGRGGGPFSLGRAETGEDAAMHRIGADLTAASRGGDASSTGLRASVVKSLRRSLREARKQRGAETEAEIKHAAAIAGKVRFEPTTDGSGRLRAIYQHSQRKEREEVVPDFPLFLLQAVLRQIASDKDENVRSNIRPENMALVSPRVFWAVVRHGGVGLDCNFTSALCNLVPDVDWQAYEQRTRAKPERYADYQSH